MIIRYCKECRTVAEVVGFQRDDPVLSCGHVKRLPSDESEKCLDDIRKEMEDQPDEVKIALYKIALESLMENSTTDISYCPICEEMVSVIRDEEGRRRCGGNYENNPGCGCLLKPISIRMHKCS